MKFIFSVNTSLKTEDDTECNLKKEKKTLKTSLCSFKKDQHHILMLLASEISSSGFSNIIKFLFFLHYF